jgi:hypothetical protein
MHYINRTVIFPLLMKSSSSTSSSSKASSMSLLTIAAGFSFQLVNCYLIFVPSVCMNCYGENTLIQKRNIYLIEQTLKCTMAGHTTFALLLVFRCFSLAQLSTFNQIPSYSNYARKRIQTYSPSLTSLSLT